MCGRVETPNSKALKVLASTSAFFPSLFSPRSDRKSSIKRGYFEEVIICARRFLRLYEHFCKQRAMEESDNCSYTTPVGDLAGRFVQPNKFYFLNTSND